MMETARAARRGPRNIFPHAAFVLALTFLCCTGDMQNVAGAVNLASLPPLERPLSMPVPSTPALDRNLSQHLSPDQGLSPVLLQTGATAEGLAGVTDSTNDACKPPSSSFTVNPDISDSSVAVECTSTGHYDLPNSADWIAAGQNCRPGTYKVPDDEVNIDYTTALQNNEQFTRDTQCSLSDSTAVMCGLDFGSTAPASCSECDGEVQADPVLFFGRTKWLCVTPATEMCYIPCQKCAPGQFDIGHAHSSDTACLTTGSEQCTVCGAENSGSTACGSQYATHTSCSPCGRTNCPPGHGPPDCTQDGAYTNACIECGQGTFSTGGSQDCNVCGSGSFADATGMSECKACEAGQYSEGPDGQVGAASCISCGQGSFTNTGLETGAATCSPCSAGNSCDGQVETECDYANNMYQDEAGKSSCKTCTSDQDMTNPIATASSCSVKYDCTGNHYFTGSSCAVCGSGSFTTTLNTDGTQSDAETTSFTACEVCPTGSYCTDGDVATACPQGSHADTTGLTTCKVCGEGTFMDETGSDAAECKACAAGMFNEFAASAGHAAHESCTACTTECNPGSEPPTCPEGSQSNQCSACQAGTYSSGTNVCQDCPEGTYSAGGLGSCIQCAAGYYSKSSDRTACIQCGAGSYTDKGTSPGAKSCTACPEGNSCDGQAATPCVPDSNFYQNEQGQSACKECTSASGAGASTFVTATSCATTYSCSGNYYYDGGQECKVCSAGSYTDTRNNARTTPYTNVGESSFTECKICPVGSYCSNGNDAVACDKGSVGSTTGLLSCTTCGQGSYMDEEGSSATCKACAEGTHNSNGADAGPEYHESCAECPQGMYADETGLVECYDHSTCHNYATLVSADGTADGECKCNAGYYGNGQPNTGCSPCGFGTYSDVSGYSACIACGKGSFADETAATSASQCKACSGGTFGTTSAIGACAGCAAGKYGDWATSGATDDAQCISCAAGKYRGTPGATDDAQCISCAAGTYGDTSAMAQCKGCAAGKYGDWATSGATDDAQCKSCAVGTYGDESGATAVSQCISCAAGKYGPTSGATAVSQCKSCAVGMYGTTSGATDDAQCISCAAGMYGNVNGASSCKSCDPEENEYQDDVGKDSCKACSKAVVTATSCEAAASKQSSSSDNDWILPVVIALICTCVAAGAIYFMLNRNRSSQVYPENEKFDSINPGGGPNKGQYEENYPTGGRTGGSGRYLEESSGSPARSKALHEKHHKHHAADAKAAKVRHHRHGDKPRARH